jgi:hypothetical protein
MMMMGVVNLFQELDCESQARTLCLHYSAIHLLCTGAGYGSESNLF